MSAVQTFGKKKVSHISTSQREDGQEEGIDNTKREDNADLVLSSINLKHATNMSIPARTYP